MSENLNKISDKISEQERIIKNLTELINDDPEMIKGKVDEIEALLNEIKEANDENNSRGPLPPVARSQEEEQFLRQLKPKDVAGELLKKELQKQRKEEEEAQRKKQQEEEQRKKEQEEEDFFISSDSFDGGSNSGKHLKRTHKHKKYNSKTRGKKGGKKVKGKHSKKRKGKRSHTKSN